MEWTAATIRRFREVGLCLPRKKFAAALGFAKRTIGNAERGTHQPSPALRHALDHALEKASDAQRDRFLAAENEASDMSALPRQRRNHTVCHWLSGWAPHYLAEKSTRPWNSPGG